MSDYIVRATAADSQIRAFAITSKEMVEEARRAHDTRPVITAALGRLLSGAAMMGTMMKGDNDLLTIQIQCGGGVMSVIKDMGLKEPYVGQIALQTGEIAEDLTYYFATSEQIPSAVGLGVLVDKDLSVRQAGGFIIQLMPFTSDEVIEKLENKIREIASVTEMLEQGMTPEQILEEILGDFGLEISDKIPAAFECDCSKERVSRAISTLSKKDLDSIINDGEAIEVKCQFCNKAYHFDVDELKEMRSAK